MVITLCLDKNMTLQKIDGHTLPDPNRPLVKSAE